VAINLTSNRAAVAVGKAARSSQDMRAFPSQGKGVHVLHVEGDLLWFGTGARPSAPDLGQPGQAEEEVEDVTTGIDHVESEDGILNDELKAEEQTISDSQILEEKVEQLEVI
jgi:hypothetical protein